MDHELDYDFWGSKQCIMTSTSLEATNESWLWQQLTFNQPMDYVWLQQWLPRKQPLDHNFDDLSGSNQWLMLYASYRHYRNHSGRLDCCNATHLRCTKFYITRSGYILTSYSKTPLYSEFAFIEFLMQGSPVSNPGVIDLLIEVTTTP